MQNVKFVLSILLLIFISCNKEAKRKVENIKMDEVSINNDYGSIIYPKLPVTKATIYNKNHKLFIYKVKTSQNFDSLYIYNDESIIYNNKKLITIDSKKIKINGNELIVKKLYEPKDKFIASCGDGDGIIYIGDNGKIAYYGMSSSKIIFYEPNKYSEFQKSILNGTNNFKRHKKELNTKP